MSLSNATESDSIDMLLKGIDPSWRAGASGYMALVTGETVDEADPMANECSYPTYARIIQTKSSAWSGTGNVRANANLIQWPKRLDGGAVQTATHAVWVDTLSGAVNMSVIIPLDADMPIGLNIRPQAEAGTLIVNIE